MIGRFPVANHPAVVLFDSGASHSFISRTFVIKHEISIEDLKESFCIFSPGGHLFDWICARLAIFHHSIRM